MTRGEVWWAELAGDAGFRPVVIVSGSNALLRKRHRSTGVSPVIHGQDAHATLDAGIFMPRGDTYHGFLERRRNVTIAEVTRSVRSLRYSLGLE